MHSHFNSRDLELDAWRGMPSMPSFDYYYNGLRQLKPPTQGRFPTDHRTTQARAMASQNVLDPRLGASTHPQPPQYSDNASRQLPPAFSGTPRTESLSYQQSPQPYYHYPSPQTQTPQQSTGPSAQQSNQTSPEGTYAQETNAGSPDVGDRDGDDPKRPRACEACRGLKVRCDQDPEHPEIPCKRCAKAGRQCIITQPSRKRQKKADSRVAELEKKLDALTAALHHSQQQTAPARYHEPAYSAPQVEMMQGRNSVGQMSGQYPPPGTSASLARPDSADGSSMPAQKRRRVEEMQMPTLDGADEVEEGGRADEWGASRYLYHTTPEQFVKRINSLISPDLAATIFNRYTTQLAPHVPAVVFPAGTTAEQVFKEKPILYVCILSAASHGTLHPDTSKQITREAIGAIADCVVRNGAKSLELIQAMQVTALWYKPPEKAEQTNFYQIIHMAAVMALDIGLGKRFNPAKAKRGFGGPNAKYAPGPGKMLPQDSDTLEARRAWLGCYYLCARYVQ